MKKRWMIGLILWAACFLTACKGEGKDPGMMDTDISAALTHQGAMELSYAEKFSVDYYEGGYDLITIPENGRFLTVPEGKEAPEDLASDITVLQKPLKNMYLAASAVMDMFVSLDALDTLRFSALKEDSWYIEGAKDAMERGTSSMPASIPRRTMNGSWPRTAALP